jgi:hypothetical protein
VKREVKRMSAINVHSITFRAARPAQVETGLLGWAGFTIGEHLRVEGIALRKTLEGRCTLTFPARRLAGKRRHFYVRPLDDSARRDIEDQVLRALNIEAQP